MEKSVIFASFLLILSITTTILLNCNYGLHFSNQKSPLHISQTAAGTFLTIAPPSSAENSPPPPKFFDWFCCHNFQTRKLYYHIILFSATIPLNLNFCQFNIPHSPKNRAKRCKLPTTLIRIFSNQLIKTLHQISTQL